MLSEDERELVRSVGFLLQVESEREEKILMKSWMRESCHELWWKELYQRESWSVPVVSSCRLRVRGRRKY